MQLRHTLLSEPSPHARLTALPYYRWLVVGTVCVGAFLGQLDASIAGLVLPTLEEVFHEPVATVEWVAISYLLTLAALVVPLGRLADLTGRKMLYTWGFAVFIGGSALCGLAPSLGWLIGFRVLQAAGAAMLQANSVAIITAAAPRRSLGRAIGVQGAAQAVGLSVGPSVGGFLIDALDWRWVFFIAVPFGIVGALMGWFVLPQTQRAEVHTAAQVQERFDWWGALLLAPALALLLLAITYGSSWGWGSPAFLGVVAASLILLGSFGLIERGARSPLVDFRLFKVKSFGFGILAGLLSYAVLFGSLFLVPFYLERVLGHGASETGLLLSPVPIALAVLAPIAGITADRVGPRALTVAGMSLAALALLALALVPGSRLLVTLAILAVLGTGLGLFTPPNNSAIMGSAPPHRLGVAGGILNMTRSLGTSLGVAVTGAILTARLSAHAGERIERTLEAPPRVLLAAFHETLLFLAGIAVAAAAISMIRGAHVSTTHLAAEKQSVPTESIGL